MIDLADILSDTKETRKRIWDVWDRVRSGKARPQEARMEIAAANAMLSAHKVALTAVHLLDSPNTTVVLPAKTNNRRSIAKHS